MDDRLSPIAKPSPELLAAQADIRDHFQPLHGLYPAHSVAAIGVAPCRFRNALYKEWQAPVYKPRMPRGKSNERAVSRPTVSPIGHRRAQTEAHISGSSGVGDRALLEPHTKIGHRRAQTRDLGNIANMSVAELRDSTAGVDCSLVPKPLRPKSRHSPLPSVDECTLITAIDVSGSLRKSKVMSIFEQQRLGIEPPFANGMGNHHRPRSRRSTTDAPTLGSDLRPSVPPKDDDAVIYFLPSSSLMSEGPHEETTEDIPLSPTGRFSGESLSTNVGSRYVVRKPGKAQKVLGEDDVGARSMRVAHGKWFFHPISSTTEY